MLPIRSVLAAIVVLAAVTACSSSPESSASPPQAPAAAQVAGGEASLAEGVTVTGSGRVSGVPDTLRATVGVEVEADSPQAALETANTRAQEVIDAIRGQGVAEEDIQTRDVSLHPRFEESPDGQPRISGYVASNLLDIKIRDVTQAGVVLDAAAEAGGDAARIQGVEFALEDNAELLEAAREAAFADAQAKAEQYAGLAGRPLGSVVSISEVVASQPPVVDEAADARAAPAPVPLAPGSEEVRVEVTVVWSLD